MGYQERTGNASSGGDQSAGVVRKRTVAVASEVTDPIGLLYQHPVLTPAQEQLLFRSYKAGLTLRKFRQDNRGFIDTFQEGREQRQIEHILGRESTLEGVIASCNFRLVATVARGYRRDGLDLKDKIAAGNSGLLEAIRRFDPAKENKLSTYAVWWIRKRIQKLVREQGYAVKIPIQVMNALPRVSEVRDAFSHVFSQQPTRDELFAQLVVNAPELPVSRIRTTLDCLDILSGKIDELQAQIAPDNPYIGIDNLRDSDADTAASAVSNVMAVRAVALIDTLPTEEHQFVVRAHFGFLDGRTHTIEEIAERMGDAYPEEMVIEILNGAIKHFQLSGIVSESGIEQSARQEQASSVVFDATDHTAVKEALKAAGFPAYRMKISQYAEVLRLQREGVTKAEIARIMEVSGTAIYLICQRLIKAGLLAEREEIVRESYRSEATERVREYMHLHPRKRRTKPIIQGSSYSDPH